jgi:1,4-dihydroxy-2-naphthoate octaprenyltransferase
MLVLYVNQIPDRLADERAGKRTIVVRLPQSAIVTG